MTKKTIILSSLLCLTAVHSVQAGKFTWGLFAAAVGYSMFNAFVAPHLSGASSPEGAMGQVAAAAPAAALAVAQRPEMINYDRVWVYCPSPDYFVLLLRRFPTIQQPQPHKGFVQYMFVFQPDGTIIDRDRMDRDTAPDHGIAGVPLWRYVEKGTQPVMAAEQPGSIAVCQETLAALAQQILQGGGEES